MKPLQRRLPAWIAGSLAGVVGGTVATIVQLVLWLAAGWQPWTMLLRDSRLAAAIVMGETVLPPASGFDWKVMFAASVVHVILSALYGLLMQPFLPATRLRTAALGAALGLVLYFINMYGFTWIFPWFVTTRDWITLAAHATFGTATALSLAWMRRHGEPLFQGLQGAAIPEAAGQAGVEQIMQDTTRNNTER